MKDIYCAFSPARNKTQVLLLTAKSSVLSRKNGPGSERRTPKIRLVVWPCLRQAFADWLLRQQEETIQDGKPRDRAQHLRKILVASRTYGPPLRLNKVAHLCPHIIQKGRGGKPGGREHVR